MSNIRQRSIKGSELTQAELDANFKSRVNAKTADYIIDKNDNEDTLEFTGTSLTTTLPAVSTITNTSTGSETGEFKVTIKNLDSTSLTITPNGLDDIDGSNSSLSLDQNESITLQTNDATDGWNTISEKKNDPPATVHSMVGGLIGSAFSNTSSSTNYCAFSPGYYTDSSLSEFTKSICPYSGTITNFRVKHGSGVSDDVTYTLHKNGGTTPLTVTITALSTAMVTDSTNSVSVSAGDFLTIQATLGTGAVVSSTWSVDITV